MFLYCPLISEGLPNAQRFPNDYIVIHDIAAQFGNIDHVAFRRDGAIFLIETKSHGGTVDEKRAEAFIRQMHRNVFWLRDLLKDCLGATCGSMRRLCFQLSAM